MPVPRTASHLICVVRSSPTTSPSPSESYVVLPGAQLSCREAGTGAPHFVPRYEAALLLPQVISAIVTALPPKGGSFSGYARPNGPR
jgi:hypothetical protein